MLLTGLRRGRTVVADELADQDARELPSRLQPIADTVLADHAEKFAIPGQTCMIAVNSSLAALIAALPSRVQS